jgi:hypothetical protein
MNVVSPLDPSAVTPEVSQQTFTVNLIGSYGACLIAIMISIAIWGTNVMQVYVCGHVWARVGSMLILLCRLIYFLT